MDFIETTIKKIEMTIGIIVLTLNILPQYNLKWFKHKPKDLNWLMFGINKNIESIGKIFHDLFSLWISYDRFVQRIELESEEYEKRNN